MHFFIVYHEPMDLLLCIPEQFQKLNHVEGFRDSDNKKMMLYNLTHILV